MGIDVKNMSTEEIIKLVGHGIAEEDVLAAKLELQRRQNSSLCKSINTLDKNIQGHSKVTINLTIAMYVLSGFALLLTTIQILIAKGVI